MSLPPQVGDAGDVHLLDLDDRQRALTGALDLVRGQRGAGVDTTAFASTYDYYRYRANVRPGFAITGGQPALPPGRVAGSDLMMSR